MIKYRGVKFRGCKSNQLMKNHNAASPSPRRARTGDHRGDGGCKAPRQTAAQNHSWCLNAMLATVRSLSCLCLIQLDAGRAVTEVIAATSPPGADVEGGLWVPGHSPTAPCFPFLQGQPLLGCHCCPQGLRTSGSPAFGPASRLKPGGGFQQGSGARNTVSQHSPDSSHFPPPVWVVPAWSITISQGSFPSDCLMRLRKYLWCFCLSFACCRQFPPRRRASSHHLVQLGL